MRHKDSCPLARDLDARTLRSMLEEFFDHLLDAVPWDQDRGPVGVYLLTPFEHACRIEAVRSFWLENGIAERILSRLHRTQARALTWAHVRRAALQTVWGYRVRLPWGAHATCDRSREPTLARPSDALSLIQLLRPFVSSFARGDLHVHSGDE